jgi:leucyl-tRNA synthetase
MTYSIFLFLGEFNFYDKVFISEINIKINQTDEYYDKLLFKEALKSGVFELQAARDKYRELCSEGGMHVDLVTRYIETQAKVMSPICPHVAEHVWELLGNVSINILLYTGRCLTRTVKIIKFSYHVVLK